MEQHNSLYRLYRPSTFKDVAGHQNIVEILTFELKNNNFNHAYLFAGQRGTGKTSVARILAKGVNCLNLQAGDPCNECENCLAFNQNQFPDIYEIDAASNNGVDEIRNIKNNVQTLPIIGKYKVYIIDEVHMLSKAAFNALLKTLEEPPKHIIFILATTEYDKIPQTIISRCQTFNFKRISSQDLTKRLNFIATEEGFTLSEEALEQIYAISEGSLRDALNDLEQLMVVAYQTKKIGIEEVKTLFYIATKTEKLEIIQQILNHQSTEIINYFERSKEQGMDFNLLALALIKMIKEIIEYKLTQDEKHLQELSLADITIFQTTPLNSFFKITDNLTEAYIKTKNTTASFDYILLSILKTIELTDEKEKTFVSQPEKISEPVENLTTEQAEVLVTESTTIETEEDSPEPTLNEEASFESDNVNEPLSIDKYSEIINKRSTNNSQTSDAEQATSVHSINDLIDKQHRLAENLPAININYLIDDLINVLMGVIKEENPLLRHELNDKLQLVFTINDQNQLLEPPVANQLVAFYGAKIAAANSNEVILTTDSLMMANLINLELSKPVIRAALFEVLGNAYVVYAVGIGMWTETKNTFATLKKKNFLPEYKQKDLEKFYQANSQKIGENQEPENQELLDKAAQLFDLTDINFGDK